MKKARLFYWEEGHDSWIPVPVNVDGELICTEDSMDEGEEITLRFKRFDMTDEEMAALPEV